MSKDRRERMSTQEMKKAIEEMLGGHYNLYKNVFGEQSNPEDDICRKGLKGVLTALEALMGEEKVEMTDKRLPLNLLRDWLILWSRAQITTSRLLELINDYFNGEVEEKPKENGTEYFGRVE